MKTNKININNISIIKIKAINKAIQNELKESRPVKSAVNPTRVEYNVSKPRRARSGSAKRQRNKNNHDNHHSNAHHQDYEDCNHNYHNHSYNDFSSDNIKNSKLTKSITSMSVQTPTAWNLRDYKNNQQRKTIPRSNSLANFQPKRAPFANYGWATKTKDLSIKPTHNALANKVNIISDSV